MITTNKVLQNYECFANDHVGKGINFPRLSPKLSNHECPLNFKVKIVNPMELTSVI